MFSLNTVNGGSYKNLCGVEIGLGIEDHLKHRRRNRVLRKEKAVKGRASLKDAPWVEVLSSPGAGDQEEE